MRKSNYDVYPGNVQILSRYVNDKITIPFSYLNQLFTTTLEHPHYGPPRLQMAWQVGFTEQEKYYGVNGLTYEEKGPIFPWPRFDTYVFTDYPDPKGPPIYTYQYWFTKQTSVSTNIFTLQTTSQAGPPGDIYQEFVHTIIFNDSFDAPFEEYVEI